MADPMAAELAYRQAKPEDSAWLFDTYTLTMRRFVADAFGWDEEAQRAGFSKSLRQGTCLIVLRDGSRCGFVHWEVEPDLVWLRMLCVVPGRQRQSIGRQAMARIVATAHDLHKPVYLQVLARNRVARAWYGRLGFEEVESEEEVVTLMRTASQGSL